MRPLADQPAFLLPRVNQLVSELKLLAARRAPTPIPRPGQLAAELARAAQELAKESVPVFSRDPIVSNLQSAIDALEFARGKGPAATSRRSGRRLFEKYSKTDIQWLGCKIAEGITHFRDKHPFVSAARLPVTIADNARLIFIGDWGSGHPSALKVAKVARQHLLAATGEAHVVHLGDVYYSGWDYEYQSRFLGPWPVKPSEAKRFGSWCLNANHDMFSGGYGYYDVMLQDPRFASQQGSSEFVLRNRHWTFVALDTAWEENTLRLSTARWALARLDAERGSVFMSHHYYFSRFEKKPLKAPPRFGAALKAKPLDAWFWGHEHRGAIYTPYMGVRHARCIGHGGIPERPTKKGKAPPKRWVREFNQTGYGSGGPWKKHGLAVADCDGDRIHVAYYDEDGGREDAETIIRHP